MRRGVGWSGPLAGRRRSLRGVAWLGAMLLVVSGLSLSALTAAIVVAPTAIGPPSHAFTDVGRGPIPRAAFEEVRAIPARGPAALGGDRVYDVDIDGTSYRVHEFTTPGTSTLRVLRPLDVDYLVVGGGGGGGGGHGGGGGGGGGHVTGEIGLTPGPVSVSVGAGGVAGREGPAAAATAGGDSTLGPITATGGGAGGQAGLAPAGAGGSGGGAAGSNLASERIGGARVAGQGEVGGAGTNDVGDGYGVGGGGGGASQAGAAAVTNAGRGGDGATSSITGVPVVRAGGGGGGGWIAQGRTGGAGGAGGGGAGSSSNGAAGAAGVDGTGGGGGGGEAGATGVGRAGGDGGSGIVIVRYPIPRGDQPNRIIATGGTITQFIGDGTNGGDDGVVYRVHTFRTSGVLDVDARTAQSDRKVEYLIVAGGGGGGFGNSNEGGGGGGAGGLRTNVGAPTELTTSSGAVTVTVGTGGAGATSTEAAGANGSSSAFDGVTAAGGGGGGSCSTSGSSGGSGGGGSGCNFDRPGGEGTTGQGNRGGNGRWISNTPGNGNGGGGGGAGGTGGNGRDRPAGTTGGAGAGLPSSIDGTTVTYARGGDGFRGSGNGTGVAGRDGLGEGAAGSAQQATARGGDGIVIVRYPVGRRIDAIPSEVRDLVAGEGRSTAVLRWRAPELSPPSPDAGGYRIERAPLTGGPWTEVIGATFSVDPDDGERVLVTLSGIAEGTSHRFRVTPIGSVDGQSRTVDPVAKGGDIVTLVGDDVVHQFTAVGAQAFVLSSERAMEALVVGGGASGTRGWCSIFWGHGGGGGGVSSGVVALGAGAYVATVGAGGAGSAAQDCNLAHTGASGGASEFASSSETLLDATGGSGAGSQQARGGTAGTGTIDGVASGGHLGGLGTGDGTIGCDTHGCGAGGGGGAGGAGSVHTAGDGVTSSITGTDVVYGRGGAGRSAGVFGEPGLGPQGVGGGGGGSDQNGGGYAAGNAGAVVLRYAFLDSGVQGGVFAEAATTAVLRWEDPADGADSITGYRIERSTDGATWSAVDAVPAVSGTMRTLELSGLPTAGARRFRVTALHGPRDGSTTELQVLGRGGSSVTLVGADVVHRYAATGAHAFLLGRARPLDVMLLGGGGGGGADSGSGGGGGALLEGRITFAADSSRTGTVVVGAGGTATLWSTGAWSTRGGESSLTLSAAGVQQFSGTAEGGRGGSRNGPASNNTNGGENTGAGAPVPAVPSLSGATWTSEVRRAGGAGGAARAGGYNNRGPGNAAPAGGGTSTLFPGTTLGGGGGGGSSDSAVRPAGTNGGGTGASVSVRATAGATDRGGGGGAGSAHGSTTPRPNTRDGEPGGSGLVLIRYPLAGAP